MNHNDRCRCSRCRHARFNPGPPSPSGRPANFYGHFSYHAKGTHKKLQDARIGSVGCQVSGPIAFGPRDFVAAAHSSNKFLAAPAPALRWVKVTGGRA